MACTSFPETILNWREDCRARGVHVTSQQPYELVTLTIEGEDTRFFALTKPLSKVSRYFSSLNFQALHNSVVIDNAEVAWVKTFVDWLTFGLPALYATFKTEYSSFQAVIDHLLFGERLQSDIYHNAIIDVAFCLRDEIDWEEGKALGEAFQYTSEGSSVRKFAVDMFLANSTQSRVGAEIGNIKNEEATTAAFRASLEGKKDQAEALTALGVCAAYHKHLTGKGCKPPSAPAPKERPHIRSESTTTAGTQQSSSIASKRQRTEDSQTSEETALPHKRYKALEGSAELELEQSSEDEEQEEAKVEVKDEGEDEDAS